MSALTITVNIATAYKREGNAEARLTFKESHLKHLDRNKLASDLGRLIDEAIANYEERNTIHYKEVP